MRVTIRVIIILAVAALARQQLKPDLPAQDRLATVTDTTGATTTGEQQESSFGGTTGGGVAESQDQETEELPPSPTSPIAQTTETEREIFEQAPTNQRTTRYRLVGNPLISWIGRNVGTTFVGTLPVSGSLQITPDLTIGQGVIYVDMSGIEETKVDNDHIEEVLRGEDYFSVDNYPRARFHLLDYSNKKVTGILTMKGVTKKITFPASINIEEDTVTANSSFAFDRTAWNVDGGLPAISRYVEVEFSLIRQAE